MNIICPAKVGFRSVFLTCIMVVSCTFSSAYCQSQKITLLVQQTPNDGGKVTPDEGAYKFDENSEVTLTAIPNNGYVFVHWLGDVSDQESTSTTVHLNKPKIVIAVFEPVKDAIEPSNNIGSSGGGGGSSLVGNHVNVGNSVSISSGGGGGFVKPEGQVVFVPAGDNPPTVPEPATGLLFALGSFLTLRKRRREKANLS